MSYNERGETKMPKFNVWELVVILVIVLVIFGPGKLPKLGKAIGETIKGFRGTKDEKPNPESKD